MTIHFNAAAHVYDVLGNLVSKAGTSYSYSTRPHAPTSISGQPYSYDTNGNLISGGGRSVSWNADNQPTQITSGGTLTETYAYDAEGLRVLRSQSRAGSVTTTVYLAGLWEEEVQSGVVRVYYSFGGQVIARRQGSEVVYLHGDHLGSISVVSNASGIVLSSQEFDSWGKVRSGGISQTTRNYTGQQRDDTGLLYYNARYYDPLVGRFASADSIVPGMASGGGGGVATLGYDGQTALTPLTVDFHEVGFVQGVNQETAFTQEQGFFFQLNEEDREQAKVQWGPANPQALNRYAYVLNNPLRYVDPSGHCPACIAGVLAAVGITVSAPVIAAIAVAVTVTAIAVFLSREENRAWLANRISAGVSSIDSFVGQLQDHILMAKKRDNRYIDR